MAEIIEFTEFKNRPAVFRDRNEAGKILGQMLAPRYRNKADVLILTIPMGGLPVALEIQKALASPMDMVIVRKIQIPGNTEAGFGAMTQEGDLFLNEPLMAHLNLDPDQISRQTEKVKQELEIRNRRLRRNRPLPRLEERTVILVDDGLASGYTMKATVFLAAKHCAARKIIAVPTATSRVLDEFKESVDEIYCPNIRDLSPFAVAAAYQRWHDINEAEAEALLEEVPG